MELNTYQMRAARSAIYKESSRIGDDQRLLYTVLGLVGEAGEVAGTMKKYLRDDTGDLALRVKLAAELGDCLWYIAMTAQEIGLPLESIAVQNITKLDDRMTRGVLGGSGDDR